jgi:hypothetical protein
MLRWSQQQHQTEEVRQTKTGQRQPAHQQQARQTYPQMPMQAWRLAYPQPYLPLVYPVKRHQSCQQQGRTVETLGMQRSQRGLQKLAQQSQQQVPGVLRLKKTSQQHCWGRAHQTQVQTLRKRHWMQASK